MKLGIVQGRLLEPVENKIQELEKISAYGEKADVPALRGWRRHIFGEDALKLASGSLGITIEEKKLKIFGKIN